MKAFARVQLRLHSFLTSTTDGGECSGYALAVLSPGKETPVPMNKNGRRMWKKAVVSSIEANYLEMLPD